MEQQSNSPINNLFDLQINEESKQLLLTITKWARIIAILAFISPAISVIKVIIPASRTGNADMIGYQLGGSIVGILVVSIVSIILNVFLYRFATSTAESLQTMSQESFNKGANNMRLYFKMLGILIIVALSLAVLFIFIMLIAVGIGAGMRS